MKRFLLVALTTGLLCPIAAQSEGLYNTKKEAIFACRAWEKKGGDSYIVGGGDNNKYMTMFRLRSCKINREKQMMVGKEFTKLKSDTTYSLIQIPELGKGLAISETIKTFRYKESEPE